MIETEFTPEEYNRRTLMRIERLIDVYKKKFEACFQGSSGRVDRLEKRIKELEGK